MLIIAGSRGRRRENPVRVSRSPYQLVFSATANFLHASPFHPPAQVQNYCPSALRRIVEYPCLLVISLRGWSLEIFEGGEKSSRWPEDAFSRCRKTSAVSLCWRLQSKGKGNSEGSSKQQRFSLAGALRNAEGRTVAASQLQYQYVHLRKFVFPLRRLQTSLLGTTFPSCKILDWLLIFDPLRAQSVD